MSSIDWLCKIAMEEAEDDRELTPLSGVSLLLLLSSTRPLRWCSLIQNSHCSLRVSVWRGKSLFSTAEVSNLFADDNQIRLHKKIPDHKP